MENKSDIRCRVKQIFKIAFPLIVQGLVFQLQSVTDKMFLGNLDTKAVSAAGAAQMPYLATMDSMVAVSTGLTIIVSRLYGAGKKDRISAYVRSMVFYSTILCIVVFTLWNFGTTGILEFFNVDPQIIDDSIAYVKICLVYLIFVGFDSSMNSMLQGRGETKPIMYAGIIKVSLNIFISWILIFGKLGLPALGVEGAAIGTLIANLVAFAVTFFYCIVYKHKDYQILDRQNRKADISLYFETIRLGIPVGLEYLLWNFSNLLLIRFVNGFSYIDTAIYTITFGFQCIVYVIFEGTSKATLSLIGHSLGEGNRRKANYFFKTTIIMNFFIVGIATLLFFILPKQFLDLLSDDEVIIERGVIYLKWIGIIMIPQSLNVICGNAIRANNNTKWMLLSQIFGSILVVSVSWFLVRKLDMSMQAIYITICLDELVRGLINLFYYTKKYGSCNIEAAK